MKKLLRDICTKTAFLFNGTVYEQIDGVSMGGSLGPLLANIIMVELEDKIVRKLINDGIIKFYTRFVDDTLLLIKKDDIERVKAEFESFDTNLKFTFDAFENKNPHFLDIEITSSGLKIFRKDTFTGHYTNFSSFVPWSHRISWIKSLVYRTKKICDKRWFNKGIRDIKKFASWNGFPRHVRDKLVKELIKHSDSPKKPEPDPNEKSVFIDLPYIGTTGERLVKQFKKKMKRLLNPDENINIKTYFKTTHLSVFTSAKDKIPKLSKSHVVYEIKCPGCGDQYIGKTDRTLFERTQEHAWIDRESPLRNHFYNCEHFQHVHQMLTINSNIFEDQIPDNIEPSIREFSIQSVRENTKILESDNNWNRLLYKEALCIERNNPTLNTGVAASRKLQLFK